MYNNRNKNLILPYTRTLNKNNSFEPSLPVFAVTLFKTVPNNFSQNFYSLNVQCETSVHKYTMAKRVTRIAKRFYCLMPQLVVNSASNERNCPSRRVDSLDRANLFDTF